MGGFYIANAPVTQREYESLMKKNPSTVKNPAQPVNNISFRDAQEFCNLMSIRDGLEPYYRLHFNASRKEFENLGNDTFASGYRLPGIIEWQYARERTGGIGVLPEYINEIKSVQSGRSFIDRSYYMMVDKEPMHVDMLASESSHSGVYPVFRVVRPILDYWKYMSGE